MHRRPSRSSTCWRICFQESGADDEDDVPSKLVWPSLHCAPFAFLNSIPRMWQVLENDERRPPDQPVSRSLPIQTLRNTPRSNVRPSLDFENSFQKRAASHEKGIASKTKHRAMTAAVAASLIMTATSAGAWPDRRVELIVPFPVGGGLDQTPIPFARIPLDGEISEQERQPIVS